MLHHGKTDAPYPFLYCSFLAVFSAMTSPYLRLMVGREKTLTTCYVCLIGESAHGRKSTSRNAAIGFFAGLESPWGAHLHVAKSLPGSSIGLIREAKRAAPKPLLMNADEFSALLAKQSIEHSTLTEDLNSRRPAEHGATSKEFDQTVECYLTMLAGTTDELWLRTFNSQAVQVGFLNRLFLVPAYRTSRIDNPGVVDESSWRELQGRVVRALRATAADAGVTFQGVTGEAGDVVSEWSRRVPAEADLKAYARVDVYVRRLAAILTVLDNPGSLEVTRQAAEVACALGTWQYESRLLAQPLEGDNQYAIREAELRRYLRPRLAGGKRSHGATFSGR